MRLSIDGSLKEIVIPKEQELKQVKEVDTIIESAKSDGRKVLSEYESKQIIAAYGVPVVRERLVFDPDSAAEAASGIGYPVALKLCSPTVSHKTEKGLIRLGLGDASELAEAVDLLKAAREDPGASFLVQEMIHGPRELVIGMTRDPQLGPAAMFGLGGIFTEILQDISFRIAPLTLHDAMEMMQEIRARKILEPVRGMEAVDLDLLAASIIAVGNIGLHHEAVQEIDVNPLIVQGGRPVAVDALVVLREDEDQG